MDQGPNPFAENFQNQRGVLGTGPVAGALGAAAAAAAMAATQLRNAGAGGLGGNSPNMFQNPGNMNDRMRMEQRRREAAREELNEIKRMRRFQFYHYAYLFYGSVEADYRGALFTENTQFLATQATIHFSLVGRQEQ